MPLITDFSNVFPPFPQCWVLSTAKTCVLHAILHLNPYREGTQVVLKHHYLYVRNVLGEDVYKTGNWRLLEAVLSAAIGRLVDVIYSDNHFDHKNVAFYLNKYVWSLFKITWPWLKNETIKKKKMSATEDPSLTPWVIKSSERWCCRQ